MTLEPISNIHKSIINNCVVFINKPAGISSNDTIQKIKRTLQIKKIGHAGTLDKFAQGMLIVLIGKATKISDILLNLDKQYKAQLCFGIETDTLDPNGTVTAQSNLPSEKKITQVVEKYLGTISQIPPQYSAIHIQGHRASDIARTGKSIDIPSREITIFSKQITHINLPQVEIKWHVSKGTYIRALARDIGRDCDSHAHLTTLHRIKIGHWSIDQSITLNELFSSHFTSNSSKIHSIESILSSLEHSIKIQIKDSQIRYNLKKGIQPLAILTQYKDSTHKIIFICDTEGLVGVWKFDINHWKHILTY